jgi:hypothetical protein
MNKIYKMIIFIYFMVILYMVLFPTKQRNRMNLDDIQNDFDKLQSYQYREEKDEDEKVIYKHRDLRELQRLPDVPEVQDVPEKVSRRTVQEAKSQRDKEKWEGVRGGLTKSDMTLDETRGYYDTKDKIMKGLGDLNLELPDETMDHYKFRDHLKDQLRIQDLKQQQKRQRERMETKEWWVKTWLKEWYESFFNINKRYYTPYEIKKQRMLEYNQS